MRPLLRPIGLAEGCAWRLDRTAQGAHENDSRVSETMTRVCVPTLVAFGACTTEPWSWTPTHRLTHLHVCHVAGHMLHS